MSANLPNGTRNIADARRYEVATQPIEIASMENSCPIEGSAIFTDDVIKGERNEDVVAIISVTFLLALAFVGCIISSNIPEFNEEALICQLV